MSGDGGSNGMTRIPADGRSRLRVLLTGASGLLGRELRRLMELRHWNVRGLAFSRCPPPLVKCDITDKAQLKQQFDEWQPDIVIHCAAERRPDVLENDPSYANQINGEVAKSVAEYSKDCGAWLIFVSTNYVFDGKSTPYNEDAEPNPLNVYGKSKLAGEIATAEVYKEAAILRLPLLYGPIEKVGETSVTSLLNTIKEPAPKLDNWQERFPTNTEDVALVMEKFVSEYVARVARGSTVPADFSGKFHWQANERHTKYSMAILIAEVAGLSTDHFIRVDDAPPPGAAPRPQFELMKCTRLETLLGIDVAGNQFRADMKTNLARHLARFI
eukprot:gnl/TRDRNA2_/TRDRNA2_134824_c0_seq1.p1 gnl/TRDRNA2_/TRDRNA2_134824_c0~~gnl/TRDRNA2_/TRDRNA2_134824_c0_seq1.p1  ORF type:complete len:329 (-),score=41.18 gnl/TRDRNA2_/TRDRNA2_134824_c0_seq1:125-1111(-)